MKCKKCNAEFDVKTNYCPHCSEPSKTEEPSTKEGCLGCLILIILAFLISSCFLGSTDEDSNYKSNENVNNKTEHIEPNISTSVKETPAKPITVPSLAEHNNDLIPLSQASKEIFQSIQNNLGARPSIKNYHHDIEDQIMSLRIQDQHYNKHIELDGYLITAHLNLISLWQAYEDGNEKQISDFIQIATENFNAFDTLSNNIKNGTVSDEYINF